MNKNLDSYKSWNIDEKDFPINGKIEEKIKFILGYGILAPSTFNSQPWKCKINKNKLDIYLDKSKITKKSDKSERFAHISMGTFIENLLIASEYFGFKTNLKLIDESDVKLKKIAEIVFFEDKRISNELLIAIKKRTTNRSAHKAQPVNESIIKELKALENNDLQIIDMDEKFKNELITISNLGDINIWSEKDFRKEHVGWVRNNLTRKYDGMPGFGVNVGLLPSLLAPIIILSPIFPKFQMKKNTKSLKSTHNFACICTKDTVKDWIKAGMIFERIALILTNKNISVSPMGQFIEDEKAREKLNDLIKLSKNFKPQIFFRLGYSTLDVPHSPRYPVEKILI